MSTLLLGAKQGQQDKAALRLVGIELRHFNDGTTLALTPSGRLYHIEADPALVYQVLRECDGSKSIAEILSRCANPVGFAEVIDTLLRDGCLRSSDPVLAEQDWIRFNSESLDPGKPASTHLVLIGDESLISAALRLTERFASIDVATFASLEEVLEK